MAVGGVWNQGSGRGGCREGGGVKMSLGIFAVVQFAGSEVLAE